MRINTRVVRAPRLTSALLLILNAQTAGFTRLDVRIEAVRTSESKHGVMRTAVLVARGNNGSGRLHQCYLCAVKLMWRHYNLGDNPLVENPKDPLEFCSKYSAVFNHVKAVQVTFLLKHLEYVHTQAEILFIRHKETRWFDHYSSELERTR